MDMTISKRKLRAYDIPGDVTPSDWIVGTIVLDASAGWHNLRSKIVRGYLDRDVYGIPVVSNLRPTNLTVDDVDGNPDTALFLVLFKMKMDGRQIDAKAAYERAIKVDLDAYTPRSEISWE